MGLILRVRPRNYLSGTKYNIGNPRPTYRKQMKL